MFIAIHGGWEGFRDSECFPDLEKAVIYAEAIVFDEEDYGTGWVKILKTNELDCSAEIVWKKYFD